ncbi:MAG: prepilin-type N-terminal cleavage/methylation domain-containing protein [Deltaproteobacteria bacterium]|nr:prepilin-type N-terminal cleavage/methylation domain-containing protein [Deltaproteobacteria bacterium]
MQSSAKPYYNANGGFTIIELLVVIAIIGVIAAIAFPAHLRYRATALDKQAQQALRTVVIAEEAYFIEHSTYVSCDETTCAALLPSVGQIVPNVTLTFTSTGTACSGIASHRSGTGAIFEWSS